jgi:hypothetical protein
MNAKAFGAGAEEQMVEKGAWFGFKVSPFAGKMIALERLEFMVQRCSANSPKQFAVYAEVDGRTERVGGGDLRNRTGNTNEEFDSYSIDLRQAALLQKLTRPVTFQIYLLGATDSPEAPGNVRIDNIVLSGKNAENSDK